MNQTYLQALTGQLKSINSNTAITVQFENNTDISINLVWLDYNGLQRTYETIAPHSTGTISTYVTHPWMFTAKATGGFIGAVVIAAGQTSVSIDYSQLVEPNDIGPPPAKTATMLIPPDGPRVVIEAALTETGAVLLREQYWRMASSSYSLAVGESKVIQYVTRTGVEQTSSTQQTIAAEVGASATGGWGPISASITSTLSTTSTTSRSFTVTEERTVDVVIELDNTTQSDITVFQWQLIDEVTIAKSDVAVASLAVAQAPEVHQTV